MTTQNLLLNSNFEGSTGGVGGSWDFPDGSFYRQAANWISTGFSGVLDAGWMTSAWGINFPHTQAAVLQAYYGGGGAISQNFSLSESSTLNLNFDYFQRNGGSGQSQEVRVLITSSTDQSIIFDQSTSAIGENNTANFTTAILKAGSYTITFETANTQAEVGDDSVFIDNLSLTATAANHAPTGTATAVLALGTEDTAYTISTADLLAGFSDVDGDTLSVTGLTATDGTLTSSGNDWIFTPNLNFNGTVALNYNVVDGHNGSVSASNSFNLVAVNDAPVAGTVTLTQTNKEDEFVIKKADLLANVTDVDSTSLSISGLTLLNPTQGELEALKDGSGWEFSAEGHKSSVVNFSYTVTDGLASSQGNVTLTLATNNSSSNQNQKIIGKDTAETLIGGNGDDIINGKDGNDSINGGNGKDILFGGKGNDTLTGGNGPDTFVFAKQFGNDIITDFAAANDKILLVGNYKWANVQQSYANGTDIVTVGTGLEAFTITLTGVSGKLEQNSFTFTKDMPDYLGN